MSVVKYYYCFYNMCFHDSILNLHLAPFGTLPVFVEFLILRDLPTEGVRN